MKRLKQFITEWNLIMLIYLILAGALAGQMVYIYHIKSELKLFKDKQNAYISPTNNNGK